MPIADYEHIADVSYERLMNDDSITKINKDYVNKFLKGYEVSTARKGIFLKHILFLLRESKDIKSEMFERDRINRYFSNIKDKTKQGYYETIKQVSIRFVKWLNDDEKPRGFKDIKNSKKGMKRDLKPSQMLTWDDAERIAKQTNSIQLKAIIFTQLDAGLRPSEFIDLKYGDISREGQIFIINVGNEHKTGGRPVPIYKSVPYLARWLEEHPIKEPDSPLWITEEMGQRRNGDTSLQYQYTALRKRLTGLAKKAGINKPLDFYALRHGACTITKLEELNPERASERFGHSLQYYEGTYGRLAPKQKIRQYQEHYNLIKSDDKQEEYSVKCAICGMVNDVKSETCYKCSSPLSMKRALESHAELTRLKSDLETLKREMSEQVALTSILLKKASEGGIRIEWDNGSPFDESNPDIE